jgi:transcriptional regulator with XRE-family HTH domain
MSSASHGPVVDGALLRKFLRSRRGALGEKQETVATALEWSLSKYTRIETGINNVTKTDLEAILRHYEVEDKEVVADLIDLARGARAPAWWDKYKFPDKAFATYVGFEAGASAIRMSQGLLVPGLLQTEDYARLVSATYVAPEDMRKVVELRLERQETIQERQPEQTYILDEAVIRRKIGDAMPKQLEHLIKMSERSEVDIRIIPFAAGPHFGMRGPFALLEFDVDLDDVLFLESARRGDLLIPPPDAGKPVGGGVSSEAVELVETIADYQEGYKALLNLAASPDESRTLLASAAAELP